jgi:hypothetical protein
LAVSDIYEFTTYGFWHDQEILNTYALIEGDTPDLTIEQWLFSFAYFLLVGFPFTDGLAALFHSDFRMGEIGYRKLPLVAGSGETRFEFNAFAGAPFVPVWPPSIWSFLEGVFRGRGVAAMPPNNTILCRLYTIAAGSRRRGEKNYGVLAKSAVGDNGYLTPGAFGTFQNAMNGMVDRFGGDSEFGHDFVWAIWSPTDHDAFPVRSVRARERIYQLDSRQIGKGV